jgi:hypothetical protein
MKNLKKLFLATLIFATIPVTSSLASGHLDLENAIIDNNEINIASQMEIIANPNENVTRKIEAANKVRDSKDVLLSIQAYVLLFKEDYSLAKNVALSNLTNFGGYQSHHGLVLTSEELKIARTEASKAVYSLVTTDLEGVTIHNKLSAADYLRVLTLNLTQENELLEKLGAIFMAETSYNHIRDHHIQDLSEQMLATIKHNLSELQNNRIESMRLMK